MDLDKYLEGDDTDETVVSDNTENQNTVDTTQASESVSSETKEEAKAESKGDALDELSKLDEAGEGEKPEDLLSRINSLGLLRRGLPVEYETEDQVREALQKWKDYEGLTTEVKQEHEKLSQEFEQQKASFQEEIKAFEAQKSEVSTKLTEYDIFEQALLNMQNEDPETFEVVADYFRKHSNSYKAMSSNPELQRMKSQMDELKGELSKYRQVEESKELEKIRSGWDGELKDVQSQYATKLRSLGVKPKWEEVQKIWEGDATGKMSVRSALLAIHGEDIEKALESRAKLAETKLKSASRQGPPKASEEQGQKSGGIKPTLDPFSAKIAELGQRYA